jgi:hypothetical protein
VFVSLGAYDASSLLPRCFARACAPSLTTGRCAQSVVHDPCWFSHGLSVQFDVQGDSAFGFSGMEIETAVRFHLPITVVIINNNGIYAGYGPCLCLASL